MRFVVAAGILAMGLTTTSEGRDMSFFFARNKNQEQAVRMLSPIGRNTGRKQRILDVTRKGGGKSRAAILNKKLRQHQVLRNAPRQEDGVALECDPQKSNSDRADVGILACGDGKYCMEDQSSRLGGFCKTANFPGPRQLQGPCDILEAEMDMVCDCTGFSEITMTGIVKCELFERTCLNPTCGDTCVDGYIITDMGLNDYSSSVCVTVDSPSGNEKACYETVPSSGLCTATWNGQSCSCTADPLAYGTDACVHTMNCPGDGPSGACDTEFFDHFEAVSECFPASEACYLCPDNIISPDAVFYDDLSCQDMQDYALTMQGYCLFSQVNANDLCCVAGDEHDGLFSEPNETNEPPQGTGDDENDNEGGLVSNSSNQAVVDDNDDAEGLSTAAIAGFAVCGALVFGCAVTVIILGVLLHRLRRDSLGNDKVGNIPAYTEGNQNDLIDAEVAEVFSES